MSDSTYYDGEAAEEAEFAGLYYEAPFDWPEPERLRTEEEGRQLGGRPMSDSTYYDGEAAEEAEFAGLYYEAPFDWPEPEQGEDQSE